MKKIKTVIEEKNAYDFYCDCCGKHIFSSIEYDDGWYDEPREYKIEFYIANYGWLSLPFGILCNDCIKEKQVKTIDKLLEIGFKKR